MNCPSEQNVLLLSPTQRSPHWGGFCGCNIFFLNFILLCDILYIDFLRLF